MSHLSLFTCENPLWDLLKPVLQPCYELPSWTCPTTSWYMLYLYGTTIPLLFRLLEGGWWTAFKWFGTTFFAIHVSFLDVYLWQFCLQIWSWDLHCRMSLALLPMLATLFHYLLQPYSLHQSHQQDIRFWVPTSIDLHLPGVIRYPTTSWYRRPRVMSPFNHHQYGIRLRVRYRFISLRYGYRFAPLISYVPIRT